MDTIDLILTLISIFILLCLSGFFSGSETALTAASRARMHHLSENGSKRAQHVQRLTEDRERLIGAILLGNNLVNILASALATSLLIFFFGDAGVVYATLVMTALVLIFAEVMPKTYAISHTDRMALAVAPIIGFVVRVFAPITTTIAFIVQRTLGLFGVSTDGADHALSVHDELRGAINLHHQEGQVVKRDKDMLGGILDLSELEVEEIMVHRKNMIMVDADQPAIDIIREVMQSPHTRIPLWQREPENIVGVLHAKDLLRAIAGDEADPDTLDILSLATKPWFVPETTSVQGQLNAFLRMKTHFALVVDEYGGLMGLVTLEDILEEIVGDIADEHDIDFIDVNREADGSVLVDGTVTIRDLNRNMDWTLPDEEATTIAGLVIHEAQTIPEKGQAFTFHGFRFTIEEKQRNQLTKLRVRPVKTMVPA
ncbi:MAG: HlyC/CorC family transporter [Parvibaculaceae bacterium]|jgi:Mg2+/Co2+ transporter CorB|nr:HlyC/CorC family transporter [Parvibaculaceae bacterium]